MGLLFKLVLLIITASAVLLGLWIHKLHQEIEVPTLQEPYWGPGTAPNKQDESIRSFKINVPDKVIADLKERLTKRRPFTPPLEGAGQHYGMNAKLLEEIVNYWSNKYDWRSREKFLNQYPHFKTKIQGLDIHYMHVKPEAKPGMKVYPMLMLHGWPGSFREFYEIIPLLTKPQPGKNFIFELIIPSLPGYGFSEGAAKKGLGPIQMSVIMKNLMKRLGINKYYLQGGDWGSMITTDLASLFEDSVLGLHTNMCVVNTPLSHLKMLLGSLMPSLVIEKAEFRDKVYPVGKTFARTLLEMGYLHLQATKPDTVGVGLNDSPTGLAAYILEKFTTWTTDSWKDLDDGGLLKKFTYDQLLDNVMIYWVTNSITTSVRLYSEALSASYLSTGYENLSVKVPTACAQFKNELFYVSEWIIRDKFKNVLQINHYNDGGHFAAFEVPKLLAGDIWEFVEKTQTVTKSA